MKYIFIGLLLLLTTGCAFNRAQIGEEGRKASDAAFHDLLWGLCNAIPVGAVKRHINTPELKESYDLICASRDKFSPE